MNSLFLMSKLRWNCKKRGECFVVKKHVKLEMFDGCFKYGLQSSDIDGITEIGGHALIQEWKDPSVKEVTEGQIIMFTNLTRINNIIAVVVYGDAETMEVSAIEVFQNGESSGIEKCNLEQLKNRITKWAESKYKLRFKQMNEL